MAQTINTNMASLNAQRNLNGSQASLNTSLERLSSGLRINSATDDAAGLAISERFTSQIRGLDQAARNANDGISLAQTAEGSLQEVTSNLQRIRELAVQSANSSYSSTDRAALQLEASQLISEIDRVAQQTNFNGVNLLDGSFSSQAFQIGANSGETITVDSIASARTSSLGQSIEASTSTTITGAVTGLTLNGQTVTAAADARDFAAAINNGSSGVSATVGASNATGASMTGAALTGTVTINGVTTASITTTTNESDSRQLVVDAINDISAATGVTATNTGADGTGVTLSAADGRTITSSLTTLTEAATGIDAGSYYGTVDLESDEAIVIAGTVTNSGLSATTINASATGVSVANIDISSLSGANDALDSIDGALQTVNSSRADLGAIQNRFESVVRSLQTSSENLSASRSRIQDTDFAVETANLTKNQILQQAGTAMLAQANSLPQNVLSLLG